MENQQEITTLYHYTDFNAMRGIICKGEIWLWNLRRMNDSKEMEYFVEKLETALQNQLGPEYFPQIQRIFSQNLKNYHKISSYAACFSEYSDDASQWSRYAKNGMGVSIAFDKKLLEQIGESGHAPLRKVSYCQDVENLEIVRQLADLIRSSAAQNEKSVIDELFYTLITNSPLFKHPSFISEKEYRLVSHPLEAEKFLGQPSFYVEETNIKKYYILNLKKICENLQIVWTDLFKQICIGPQARVTPEVLGDFFEWNGAAPLKEKIIMSDCPLRRF